VQYLADLGFQPRQIRGDDHWYLSPLREEKTPSFKVNKKFNIWYDHGIGKGGNLIDFGILYHRCTVKDLLQKMTGISSFQQHPPLPIGDHPNSQFPASAIRLEPASPIHIGSVNEIKNPSLIAYLNLRGIPIWVASGYCQQVDFELHKKQICALGFPNRSGGYELRNTNFKGCSPPKDLSFFDHGQDRVTVFEGFFSFLSFRTLQVDSPPLTNFLVLNSLAFLEKARPLMERYSDVDLYLDNDRAGKEATAKALDWGQKYGDRRNLYAQFEDCNDYLRDIGPPNRQNTQTQPKP